jgi:carotenoid cleavage dioxygenase-like enzyme
MLLRIGPNPVEVPDPKAYHWFTGDGMVHAIELRDGQAVSYRNRWVQTRKLAAETGSRPPRGPEEAINGSANTNVVWHAGRVLALYEVSFPHRMTTALETVSVEDFDGTLTSPMTAHPHVDPETGAMAFFGYDALGPPFLRYHELDAAGSMVHTTEIEIPQATMQHDFGVTASRVAFMDLPVVFNLDQAMEGRSMPFQWDASAGARVGVLDRGANGSAIKWASLDPCYVFHVMNAFDDGDTVVMDVCRYASTFDTEPGDLIGSTLSTLQRWRIEPGDPHVQITDLDDRNVEFPRIDDTLAGRPYRYGYCTETARGADHSEEWGGLVRYDLVRDEARHYEFGQGQDPGEPIFVRAPDGRSDDEGWVLVMVYDATRNASDLHIIDASSFDGKPEAIVHLPVRVPFGFHGSWVPIDRYR